MFVLGNGRVGETVGSFEQSIHPLLMAAQSYKYTDFTDNSRKMTETLLSKLQPSKAQPSLAWQATWFILVVGRVIWHDQPTNTLHSRYFPHTPVNPKPYRKERITSVSSQARNLQGPFIDYLI